MTEFNLDILIRDVDATAKKLRWVIQGFATTTDLGTDDSVIEKEALEAAADDLLRRSTILFNHNQDRPVGKVIDTDVRETADGWGLFIKGEISKTEADIWQKIQDGTLNKFSIRGRILESFENYDEGIKKNIRHIAKLELLEVSVVSVPAVAEAQILEVSVERKAKNEGGEKSMPDNPEVKKPDEPKPATPEVKKADATPPEVKPPEVKPPEVAREYPMPKDLGEKLDSILGILKGLVTSLQEGKYPLPSKKDADATPDSTEKKVDEALASLKALTTQLDANKQATDSAVKSLSDSVNGKVDSLRADLEKGQILRNVPTNPNPAKNPFEDPEFLKLSPQEQLRTLGGLLAKK